MVERAGVDQGLVVEDGSGVGVVGEFGLCIPWLQPGGVADAGGEIVAAGDGDGAEPGSVRGVTVRAVPCERVFGGGGGIARDLLQGVQKVLVEAFGVVVVKGSEGC